MTAVNLTTAQALAKTCLAANAAFAGLSITTELDEAATPDELAAAEAEFESALQTTGVAVVILSPEISAVDKCDGAALSGRLALGIAICENPEVNRGAADPTATPARTPANKSCRSLVESAIRALLPEFTFPSQAAGRPTWANGFWAYYLIAEKRHLIRA